MLKKVMVVEDSMLQAKMYRMIFDRHQGCRLLFAANGLEGLDQLVLEPDIQLIILDINMPKMNGLTFLESMQRDGFGHIPVIVISTEGKDDDIKRALELGARGYVKKPWQPEQVQGLIDRIFAA